ncbi:MAG TPA: SDR family NAD(P)-dependent oxidoreductase [Actinophytocola sp.]|jgi:3-oxoacyl-[acyl-carrier protein] reductase|nr:SDR family NAD(P)-dependent oxidoreductase [Actinophytocola sp.]
MDFASDRLDGRCVVVTGGGSGIGLATSLLAAGRGATVVAADRDADGLARLAEAAGSLDVTTVRCDVSDAESVGELFTVAAGTGKPLRGLANCAGITADRPFDALSLEHWQHVLGVNLTGTYLVAHAGVRAMGPDGGSVVLVGSGTTNTPTPGLAHYTASKAGVIGLSRALAKELGGRGIRVNTVSPGPIDTPLLRARMSDEVVAERSRTALLGRLGRPQDVALLIGFLLSDQSGWITGQTINVNGGTAMT